MTEMSYLWLMASFKCFETRTWCLMLLLLEKEMFSFTLPLPLSFLYAELGKKWLSHKRTIHTEKNPVIFLTFHLKRGGVKVRIIKKLPEHYRNTCLTPTKMLWLSFSQVNICSPVWTMPKLKEARRKNQRAFLRFDKLVNPVNSGSTIAENASGESSNAD